MEQAERGLFKRALNVLAVIMTLVANGLANALPLNGQRTGEIADRFQVYFVPAGYVFSIWGLIYVGLIVFGVYQALPGQRRSAAIARIDNLFVLSCAANITWLFLWHYERFPATLLAMGALFGSLLAIYLRLRQTRPQSGERWFVRLPFSIYLGWISVATIANVTVVLDYIGWNGWGISDAGWTMIMLGAGGLLGLLMGVLRRDLTYVLVIIWAFVGIAIKHASTAPVATTAWLISGLLGILLLFLIWRRRADAVALSS